nr:spastin-like [Oncorhynchus nerka]
MSAKVRAGDSNDNGEIIRNYHKRAFEYISVALKIDEDDKGVKEEAVQWYQNGIAELQRGIAIEVTGQGEHCDRSKRLQTKMINNLTMAKDRLALLEGTSASKTSHSPQSPPGHLPTPPVRPTGPKNKPGPGHSKPASTGSSRTNNIKVVPRAAGRGQNGRPAASKEPQKRDMKNFKNVDSKLASFILNEIVDGGSSVSFEDIAGQELAKQALQEIVILPALRPEVNMFAFYSCVMSCCLSVMPDSHSRVKPTQAELLRSGLFTHPRAGHSTVEVGPIVGIRLHSCLVVSCPV